MSNFINVSLKDIDPESSVNVRKTAVEDNIENVKRSIEKDGFWLDQPIVVRPHPDKESKFKYEYVTGQCRFKASKELGLEKIPALEVDLDDDAALRRSWGENEARGELTPSDQSYWAEHIFKKYEGSGCTMEEAQQKAADWLGVTLPTLRKYYSWAFLPEDVKEMMDQGVLAKKYATAIVKNTFSRRGSHEASKTKEKMIERANWMLDLDRETRDMAVEVMQKLPATAKVTELAEGVKELQGKQERVVQYEIPENLYQNLIKYGEQRGLKEPITIVNNILAETLANE